MSDSHEDQINPAKGLLFGLLLGFVIWGLILLFIIVGLKL